MIPDKYLGLLDKLIEKTHNSEVVWQKTSRESEYKVELQSGAITTDKWRHEKKNFLCVDVTFFNDRGDNIDRIYANEVEYPMEFAYLDNLYSEVKRAYYKVDETLKGLLDEINTSGKVGKIPPESDLPF